MMVPFSEVGAEGSNLSISPDEPKQREKSSAITLFTVIVQTSKQIENSCENDMWKSMFAFKMIAIL